MVNKQGHLYHMRLELILLVHVLDHLHVSTDCEHRECQASPGRGARAIGLVWTQEITCEEDLHAVSLPGQTTWNTVSFHVFSILFNSLHLPC